MSGRRWVVEEFISRAVCRELIRVHLASGVVGYRDRFSVTTLREPLARTPDWPLLLPFVRLRGTSSHYYFLFPSFPVN